MCYTMTIYHLSLPTDIFITSKLEPEFALMIGFSIFLLAQQNKMEELKFGSKAGHINNSVGNKHYASYGYLTPTDWFNEDEVKELEYYLNVEPKEKRLGTYPLMQYL